MKGLLVLIVLYDKSGMDDLLTDNLKSRDARAP